MNKPLFILCALVVAAGAIFHAGGGGIPAGNVRDVLTALLLKSELSQHMLLDAYKNERIKIIIVPGHDAGSPGAYYRGLQEANLTLRLAEELASFLREDQKFEIAVTRDRHGYTSDFQKYFSEERAAIGSFREYIRNFFAKARQDGIATDAAGIVHRTAGNETSLKLYGINKWANDHGYHLVIHIHFNDYERRPGEIPQYAGFTIYYPERRLPNHTISLPVARSVWNTMNTYYAPSNLPLEQNGLVASDDLIAVGSNGSLNPASILIEYAYIYESRITNNEIRALMLRDLAYQTYLGIKRSFDPYYKGYAFGTTLLPHQWQTYTEFLTAHDVASLQAALMHAKLYPPAGQTRITCPITGAFGPCTKAALLSFAKKYAGGNTHALTTKMLETLNALYGPAKAARP